MARAYGRLHELGWAHSLEVWDGDRLVGGLYGVQVGGVFTGESMFHRAPDASKVALVDLVARLLEAGGGRGRRPAHDAAPHLPRGAGRPTRRLPPGAGGRTRPRRPPGGRAPRRRRPLAARGHLTRRVPRRASHRYPGSHRGGRVRPSLASRAPWRSPPTRGCALVRARHEEPVVTDTVTRRYPDEDFEIRDISPRRVGPQGDRPRRARDARPHGAARAARR